MHNIKLMLNVWKDNGVKTLFALSLILYVWFLIIPNSESVNIGIWLTTIWEKKIILLEDGHVLKSGNDPQRFVETCDQYPFSLAASSLLVSLFYEARQEKFGDTKGVIRRQRTNYELQSTIQKTTDWATWIPLNITGETSNCPEV